MGRRWAIVAITVFAAAACSRGGAAAGTSPTTTVPPAKPAPGAPQSAAQPSLREAINILLTAEEHGDHGASFVVLSDESRSTYRDVARWKARRDEVPDVTGFKVIGAGKTANSLDVMVDHAPALDPYRGLSPARDHETWVGRREHGGWLVDADPSTKPVLPADNAVAPAALAWVKAASSCQQAAIGRLQAVDPLLGIGNAGHQLCGQHASLTSSAPSSVPPGDMTQQLVAQYGADALGWARVVTLSGAPSPIQVLLAPIGDGWQVIGVYA
jgi:hypothetical protein